MDDQQPKNYCFALDLQNDPEKIKAYKDHHKKVWPEILQSIRASGIEKAEIFHTGTRLFMRIEVNADFTLEEKAKKEVADPKVQEWEQLMWEYQQALPNTPPGTKWVLMDKIFDLNK